MSVYRTLGLEGCGIGLFFHGGEERFIAQKACGGESSSLRGLRLGMTGVGGAQIRFGALLRADECRTYGAGHNFIRVVPRAHALG
jgi:hypothetical protein